MPQTFHVPAHPGSTGKAVSSRMSRLRRRDNSAETTVRRLLHAAGYRYRVNYPVPGLPRRTIDIAFVGPKVAVFIDGCFWHGCAEHGTQPRSNREWWSIKLAANRARDADTSAHLRGLGWLVLRYWEHVEATEAAAQVERMVASLASEANRPGAGSDQRDLRG